MITVPRSARAIIGLLVAVVLPLPLPLACRDSDDARTRQLPAPPAPRVDTIVTARFAPRASVLDSIARAYHNGPSPATVDASGQATTPNRADPHVADRRIAMLHTLLARAGVDAVFRDARYPGCVFVRVAGAGTRQTGYLYAPEGCRVPAPGTGPFIALERLAPEWWGYRTE